MRILATVLIASAATACATAVEPPTRSAEAEAELNKLLAGKAAGPPVQCLHSYRSRDMVVIDDSTVAFRDGSQVYVNSLQGSCNRLGGGSYALVTRSIGPSLCNGDIAQVADLSSGMTVGSCVLGEFVPYRTAG